PYAIAKYRSRAMRRELAARGASGGVDVLGCDFLAPSIHVPDGLPCSAIRFEHNVESLIWKRHWQVARDPVSRRYFSAQWRRMRAFEARECRRYQHVVVVSPNDRNVMSREYGVRRVSDIATGVDASYFRPNGKVLRDADRMVFTGRMYGSRHQAERRVCIEVTL